MSVYFASTHVFMAFLILGVLLRGVGWIERLIYVCVLTNGMRETRQGGSGRNLLAPPPPPKKPRVVFFLKTPQPSTPKVKKLDKKLRLHLKYQLS